MFHSQLYTSACIDCMSVSTRTYGVPTIILFLTNQSYLFVYSVADCDGVLTECFEAASMTL